MNPSIPLMSTSDPSKWNVSEDGASAAGGTPVSNIMYSYKNGKDQWLLGTATIKARIIDGLNFHGSANVDRRQYQGVYYEISSISTHIKNNRQVMLRMSSTKPTTSAMTLI